MKLVEVQLESGKTTALNPDHIVEMGVTYVSGKLDITPVKLVDGRDLQVIGDSKSLVKSFCK